MITEEMLWNYADGLLTEAEKLMVEAHLTQYPEDRVKLEAVLAEKRAFAALPLENPRAGFADGVMAAWAATQAQTLVAKPGKSRDWILVALAVLMGALLLGALLLGIGLAPAMPAVSVPDQYMPQMPVVDWATLLESATLRYGIILTIAVLMLQILDKYLQQRNKLTMAQ
jgi:anti-sigma factor RsiW